ncbi:MAG: trigger factor [Methylococcaceae bacterium NSP1-2]|nr:trigger factor [Methylococcaceae bacterium]OYV17578.1 MAG: trigger factor [Methylococcaceae bacterium NSP1-2]
MQVSVEKTSELSRKMTVSVPETVVQEKMAERLKTLAREVKIHGFRPGKVPQQVVAKMYGDKVRDEITGDLIQSTYYEALQSESLRPAGYPHIQHTDDAEGFAYTAVFEVYPEIVLEGLEQLEVVRPVATVGDVDVDNIIEKLREQKKEWTVVERAAQEHDQVTINFSGVSEGTNFTNGKVENFLVEIGAKKMIPGFEDQLIGLEVGANKTFELTFPAEYGNAELAGKTAQFDIEVVKIEEASLPEIDEAFIKAYGVEEGSVDAFRTDVKDNLGRELKQVLRGKLKNAVMDSLYAKFQIAVPNSLIDEEVERLMQPYLESAKRQKMKPEDMQLPRDVFEEQAKRRVALGLILGEIIQKNTVEIDSDKVRETIEELAKSYEHPEDVVAWYYADEKRLHDVQQMVLEDQVVEWLVAQAKVTDETVSFSDVMDRQQQ